VHLPGVDNCEEECAPSPKCHPENFETETSVFCREFPERSPNRTHNICNKNDTKFRPAATNDENRHEKLTFSSFR